MPLCGWRVRLYGLKSENHCRSAGGFLLSVGVFFILLAGFFLIALLRVFSAPLKLAVKLLVNTLLGFLALWAVNATAGVTGVALGINVWNALVIGVLGLPGFVLLLLVQWVL